jgi:outer membrane protein assembly factor BamD (BamD/ComL family)
VTGAAALLSLAATGCVHRPGFLQPAAQRDWPAAYLAAQTAADHGAYADADKTLADFAASHPGSPEAAESGYWRAVYKLDPANKDASTRDAIAALDKYLASSPDGTHRGEATTLRRIATQLLSLDRALTQKPDETAASRDEEVKKLKDELQATKDELERIKRRLAAPKP